jgi:hypothetical protein
MTDDFDAATAVSEAGRGPAGERRFGGDVPDGWQQGRGAFGGLVLGMLLRAMERACADPDRRVRSLTGEITGPVLPGPVEVHVVPLRRGSNVSFFDARLLQGGEILARASAVFGAPRAVDAGPVPLAPPAPPPWQEVPVVPVTPPVAPVFARHYAFRVTGPVPFSGGAVPEAAGYISERRGRIAWDAPALVGHADAYWPAIFATASAPRPTATVSFTLQILADPRGLDAAPIFVRTRATGGADGYVAEVRELWQGGTLVAINHQTFVVIR